MRWIWFTVTIIGLAGCTWFQPQQSEKAVARVYDDYLYESELYALIPPGTPSADSLRIAQSFIRKWVEERIGLHMADVNLPEKVNSIEKKVENYRNSLVIFEYEEELIRQKMDTNISNGEIETYYENNRENFELKDYIIKVIYAKINKEAPRIKKAFQWFGSEGVDDFHKLEEYCHQFAVKFFVNDQTWIYLDDFVPELPEVPEDKVNFLQQDFPVRLEDESFFYFVNVTEFMLRDSISPLDLEKERIRKIIMNKRKLDFLARSRQELYNKEMKNGNIELYGKPE